MRNKLKIVREKKDMTQKELVEKSGVSRTVISQLENGTRSVVTSETMLKISKALEEPLEDIFLP
ncbi:MAG: helix-turn-helix transcriptional regulator [Bacillota bacterium]|nr:helix-turn-helix transcriptional regulator [Bacillota bacterium]